MKFGFIIPHNYGLDDPDDVLNMGIRAEELGFDSVWVNHHVLNVGYILDRLGSKPYFDALTVLTWVAAHTQHVGLGTTVLVLPYLNPLVLAKTLATIDVMSKGRLVVGVGVGALKPESDALGSTYETRGRYANECIEVMRELWTAENPRYAGEFFSFSGVKFSPKPTKKYGPPIIIGGTSRAAIKRVAMHGDGWHPIGQTTLELSENIEIIKRLAGEHGRDPTSIHISVRAELQITDSRVFEARSPMKGTEDQLADMIYKYEELGVSELVLSVNTSDIGEIERMQDRFSERIIKNRIV